MEYQKMFERYEIKYLVNKKQREAIEARMAAGGMKPDQYGRHTIRNIYFDTPSYILIRESMEKPVYKEKLRMRSYCLASEESPVFLELKKKFQSIVYKRRICLQEKEAMDYMLRGKQLPEESQVGHELDYFKEFYRSLRPSMFLTYDREAHASFEDSDLRVTFDQNILWRTRDMDLKKTVYGYELLPRGYSLMEVKTSGAIPLWMVEVLTEQQVYKTSFSKYGHAFQTLMQMQGRRNNHV